MKNFHIPLLLPAVVLEVALISLYGLELRSSLHVAGFITAYLAAFLSYLFSCYLVISRCRADSKRDRMRLIWCVAILFRLTALPLDPQLSEDLHRYRWNGKVQASGGNPYVEVPQSPEWKSLRDGGYEQVAEKHLPTIYGPVLEMVYVGTYHVVKVVSEDPLLQAWLFKIPFALIELGIGLALAGILTALGKPKSWLLIYLWSPLVIIEFWAQGHNDTLVMLFLVLVCASVVHHRWNLAWAWLTMAVLTKIWPLILTPILLFGRKNGNIYFSGRAAIFCLTLSFLIIFPYWSGILQVGETLTAFSDGRQNNASIYALVLAMCGGNYMVATVITGGVLVSYIFFLAVSQLEVIRGVMAATVALLLLSANCFPWYLGWFVPFLAIYPNTGLLLWTGLVTLSYHILIGYFTLQIWAENHVFQLMEYIPVYVMLLGSSYAFLRRFGTCREDALEPCTKFLAKLTKNHSLASTSPPNRRTGRNS